MRVMSLESTLNKMKKELSHSRVSALQLLLVLPLGSLYVVGVLTG